jgi:hypothetical protein
VIVDSLGTYKWPLSVDHYPILAAGAISMCMYRIGELLEVGWEVLLFVLNLPVQEP